MTLADELRRAPKLRAKRSDAYFHARLAEIQAQRRRKPK